MARMCSCSGNEGCVGDVKACFMCLRVSRSKLDESVSKKSVSVT